MARRTQRPSRRPATGGSPPPHRIDRARALAGAAALAAAAFLVYTPALHGGVLWDDAAHITPRALRSLPGLLHIWFTPGATQQFYPVLHSAFWVEWQLWQGNTFGYHVANVAQHAIAACLLWGVLRRLRVPGAFLAAAIFVVHPVNVESVAWITEQKNTLSTVFYLAAAWCYLIFEDGPTQTWRLPWGPVTTRPPRWYAAAFALFVLGLLSKTTIATLPAALLVVAWWRRGRIGAARDVVPLVPWFALGALGGAVTAWFERVLIGAQGTAWELDLVQRCLLAGRVVWFYLRTLFWPTELIFFYPRWVVDAGDWTWWIYPIGVVAAAGALWLVAVRFGRRAPLAAVLFFVGTLVPALGFINVYPFRFSYVADHFQYQAAIGIVVFVAGGLMWLARVRPAWRYGIYAGSMTIVATLGWLTWKQSDQYGHDAIYHYQAILARNPGSWISYGNWASELMNKGQYAEAIPLLHKALGLNPEHFEALRDAGTAYEKVGRLKEALPFYERAVHQDPDPKVSEHLYGNALVRSGRVDEGMRHLQKAIDIADREQTPFPGYHIDLGRAYVTAGKLDEAIAEFRLAQQRAGGNQPAADMLIGDTLVRMKRDDEAVPYLRRAIEADPGDAIHRFDLGRILFNAGRYEEAAPLLAEAIDLRADLIDAYVALALAQFKLGREADARATAARAMQVAGRLLQPHELRSLEDALAPVLKR